MSDIKIECNEFLKKDEEGFQNPDFKPSLFIVGIMPTIKDGVAEDTSKFIQKFRELEKKEEEVDRMVSNIIHQRFDQFTELISKPILYGVRGR
jgi:hypothetical protein